MPTPEPERTEPRVEGISHPVPAWPSVAAAPAVFRGAGRPASLSTRPDPLGLLKALRRRWPTAVFGGLLVAAAAGTLGYFFAPAPKYTARALLRVSSLPNRIIFSTRENISDYRTYQGTQVTLLKSNRVLREALSHPEVAAIETVRDQVDDVGWLEKEIKVLFPGGSEVLQISMTGSNAREMAVLVNAVTDAYLKEIVAEEQAERQTRFFKLKALFNTYQGDLKGKRKELRELADTVGSNDKKGLDVKSQLAAEHMALAKQELLQLQVELRKMQVRRQVVKSRGAEPEPPKNPNAVIEAAVEREPAVASQKEKLAKLQNQIREARRRSRNESDPAIRRPVAEAAAATQELERLQAGARAAILQRGEPNRPRTPLEELDQYIEILVEQEKAIREQVDGIEADLKTFNVKSMDFHQLQEEISLSDSAAKLVGTEVEALNVELSAPSRIKLLEKAEVPKTGDSISNLKLCGMASGAAMVLFVGFTALWEFRSRRIDTVEEVVDGLGLRLVGALPKLPQGPQNDRSKLRDRLLDSIDAARTMLLHAARTEGLRAVLICSPVKGEGKTTLSCHLASSLARGGKRTLLVDCDLRNPATHRVFGQAPEPGLCELLRGEVALDAIIHPTPLANLSLLPAGRVDTSAIHALASDELNDLFALLREQYDFVVVDTAPLLLVSDTLIFCQHIDAVIFSVLRGVSRLPRVHAAYEQLAALGVRVLGAVVLGTNEDRDGYGYHYDYHVRDRRPLPGPERDGHAT